MGVVFVGVVFGRGWLGDSVGGVYNIYIYIYIIL